MKRVLVLDAAPGLRQQVHDRLQTDGHEVVLLQSADAAQEITGIDAIVLCPTSDESVFLQWLDALRARHRQVPVIALTTSHDVSIAALRAGVYYSCREPFNPDEISIVTRRAVSSPSRAEYCLPAAGIDFRDLEREVLAQALRLANGNQTRAASLLRLTRDQIRYRLNKFGMLRRDDAVAA